MSFSEDYLPYESNIYQYSFEYSFHKEHTNCTYPNQLQSQIDSFDFNNQNFTEGDFNYLGANQQSNYIQLQNNETAIAPGTHYYQLNISSTLEYPNNNSTKNSIGINDNFGRNNNDSGSYNQSTASSSYDFDDHSFSTASHKNSSYNHFNQTNISSFQSKESLSNTKSRKCSLKKLTAVQKFRNKLNEMNKKIILEKKKKLEKLEKLKRVKDELCWMLQKTGSIPLHGDDWYFVNNLHAELEQI